MCKTILYQSINIYMCVSTSIVIMLSLIHGRTPGTPVPSSPYGLCGRKATFEEGRGRCLYNGVRIKYSGKVTAPWNMTV